MTARRLLLLAATLLPTLAAATPALPDSNFVYVTGQATEHLPPARCTLRATLKATAKSAEQAMAALQRMSSVVIAAAKANGVAMADVDGSEISKSLPYSEKDDRLPESKRVFNFRLGDLKQCVALSDKLMATPGVQEFAVNFAVTDEPAADAKATASAVADARRRAQALADQLGRKLGRAIAISEEPMDAVGSRFGASRRELPPAPFVPHSDDASLEYAVPKSLGFSKTVYVIFGLE